MKKVAVSAAESIILKKSVVLSQLKEQSIPILKGADVVLDLNCQDVNCCLQHLRKGLTRLGAKVVVDLSPDVTCVISSRSLDSITATAAEQSKHSQMALTRTSRRRSTQIAQKAILPNITKTDIISKAKRLGVSVISVDAILKKLSEKSSDASNKELPHYAANKVAIQDAEEKYRPIVKEFPNGSPKMRMDAPPGQCPFSNKNTSDSVTNQQQSVTKSSAHHQLKKKRRLIVSGYCEICRTLVNDVEAHLSSKEHIGLADDDILWRQVDICIAGLKLFSVIDDHDENSSSNILQVNSELKCDC